MIKEVTKSFNDNYQHVLVIIYTHNCVYIVIYIYSYIYIYIYIS